MCVCVYLYVYVCVFCVYVLCSVCVKCVNATCRGNGVLMNLLVYRFIEQTILETKWT